MRLHLLPSHADQTGAAACRFWKRAETGAAKPKWQWALAGRSKLTNYSLSGGSRYLMTKRYRFLNQKLQVRPISSLSSILDRVALLLGRHRGSPADVLVASGRTYHFTPSHSHRTTPCKMIRCHPNINASRTLWLSLSKTPSLPRPDVQNHPNSQPNHPKALQSP